MPVWPAPLAWPDAGALSEVACHVTAAQLVKRCTQRDREFGADSRSPLAAQRVQRDRCASTRERVAWFGSI
jgi:hypothetical protein